MVFNSSSTACICSSDTHGYNSWKSLSVLPPANSFRNELMCTRVPGKDGLPPRISGSICIALLEFALPLSITPVYTHRLVRWQPLNDCHWLPHLSSLLKIPSTFPMASEIGIMGKVSAGETFLLAHRHMLRLVRCDAWQPTELLHPTRLVSSAICALTTVRRVWCRLARKSWRNACLCPSP